MKTKKSAEAGRTGARRKSLKSFTLVELLVVVAIMGILLTLLLPALRNAREISKRAVCQSNMKQIGFGVMQYATDYGGWMPCRGAAYVGGTLTTVLRDGPTAILPYVPVKMWACPSATFRTYKVGVSNPPYLQIGWEAAFGYQGLYKWQKMQKFDVPSRVCYAGDMAPCAEGSMGWYYGCAYLADGLDNNTDFRHNNTWNTLFLDGHGKSYPSIKRFQEECLIPKLTWLEYY